MNNTKDNNTSYANDAVSLITLDNADYSNITGKINSPRSIEALRQLGIDQRKVYLISFPDYIYMHPELKSIPYDLQVRSYVHYEQKRKERIDKAKAKRNELIDFNSKSINNSKLNKSKSLSQYNAEQASIIIQEERERLNLMKKQQIGELKNIIDFEFRLEEIRKKNEQKMMIKEKKDEEIRSIRKEEAKERESKKKIQELKKEYRSKAEMEELERKERERQEEEQRLLFEENLRRETIEREKQRRANESRIKQEEFRKKIDNLLIDQQRDSIEKQKEMYMKEEQRKKNIERMKKETWRKSQEKNKYKTKRVDQILMRNNSAYSCRQFDFERKQKSAEEIRNKFEIERIEKKKQLDFIQKQREIEIAQILKSNEDKLKARLDQYHFKQQKITMRQKERDSLLQQSMQEKRFWIMEKENKCIESRKKNETLIEDNRKKIIDKINSIEEKIKKQQEYNSRNIKEKFIELSMRKEDIENNIEQNEKAMEYLRLQRLEEIEMKNKKIEEMKKQKIELMEEKKKMGIELQRSKEKMMMKLEFLKKRNKYNDKNKLYNDLFYQSNNSTVCNQTKSRSTRESKNGLYDNIALLEKAHQIQNSSGKEKDQFEFTTDEKKNNNKQSLNKIINEDDNAKQM